MKDNWSDEAFTTDWDSDAAVRNPTRSLLLDLLTSIVADSYVKGNKILDLGFGSGHVENRLFTKFPNAQIVGIDSSEVMIGKAHEKLKNNRNVTMIKHDLASINSLVLPEGQYQFAITSFVLHEIPSAQKREIFTFLYKTLMPQGIYILVDRLKIDSDGLFFPYKSQWDWQKLHATSNSKKSFEEYTKEMSVKQDSPDFVEVQLNWLREAGFKSSCLQLQLDRGLIVAVKP